MREPAYKKVKIPNQTYKDFIKRNYLKQNINSCISSNIKTYQFLNAPLFYLTQEEEKTTLTIRILSCIPISEMSMWGEMFILGRMILS